MILLVYLKTKIFTSVITFENKARTRGWKKNLLSELEEVDFFTKVAVLLTGRLTGFGLTLPAFGLSTAFATGSACVSTTFLVAFGFASITAFSEASLIYSNGNGKITKK